MSTLPFSTFDLQSHEVDAISNIYEHLEQKFEVSYDTNFTCDFSALEIFGYREIITGPAINIINDHQSLDLVFLKVGYSYSYARKYTFGLTYEYQAWGIISLKRDFGHILIKPETFLDKIHEFLNPLEVDFPEDSDFSKNFYVVAKDELKTRLSLDESVRKCIKNISVNEFIIEFINNKLIIGNRKVIEVGSALSFVKFMDELSTIC